VSAPKPRPTFQNRSVKKPEPLTPDQELVLEPVKALRVKKELVSYTYEDGMRIMHVNGVPIKAERIPEPKPVKKVRKPMSDPDGILDDED
jgi:hypothetical protein